MDERHHEVIGALTGRTGRCVCSEPWPCPDATEKVRADRAEAALGLMRIRANGMEYARNAAIARADKAEAALRGMTMDALNEHKRADKAEAELGEANALLVPIEWWYCVWCETKYPFTDDVDVLKTHSANCEKHPAVQQRDRLAEALRDLVRETSALGNEHGVSGYLGARLTDARLAIDAIKEGE